MIRRVQEIKKLKGFLERFPVVGIVGARQVGKTTLARMLAEETDEPVTHFDLENPEDYSRLSDPMLVLKDMAGLVIFDEIQRYPDLFPVLRVLADRRESRARFLILGSASPALLHQSSESLAGRIIYHELGGFSLHETESPNYNMLWLRGGFPRSYLGESDSKSFEWRRAFVQTFLERDLPQLGISIHSTTLRRFWTMLAHYHGQVWNASEIGRSFGVADTTVRNYLDILSSALVLRQLPPWFENISKRQVKAQKIYISDSGLLHTLLNIRSMEDLESNPKSGASWEGFILDQLVRILEAEKEECYFWSTHAGAELDLLIVRSNKRYGFEIKRTTRPTITPSMRSAISNLKLQSLQVIHAGDHTFKLADNIKAVSVNHLLSELDPL